MLRCHASSSSCVTAAATRRLLASICEINNCSHSDSSLTLPTPGTTNILSFWEMTLLGGKEGGREEGREGGREGGSVGIRGTLVLSFT